MIRDPVGERVMTTLITKTIDDITADQMNRIVRRLSRMPKTERDYPKRVADVITEELGPELAIDYIDKALAAGQITVREYDEMRATILLTAPRRTVPPPLVRQMSAEILESQRKLREDFRRLTGQGQEAFRKPFTALDKDVKRIRKAWGL